MASIFYTDAPIIDASPPYTVQPTAEPVRSDRALRNWQIFVISYALIVAGCALLLYQLARQLGASNFTIANIYAELVITAAAVALWLLTGLLILFVAWRKGRL